MPKGIPDGPVNDDFIGISGGYLCKTAEGVYAVLKDNRAATAAPTATDDSTANYGVGSLWIDVTADKVYKCVDATASAAVWKDLTASGGLTKTWFQEITVNTTTTATAWTDLMTLNLTPSGGDLIIEFSCSPSLDAKDKKGSFQLLYDGTPLRGAHMVAGIPASGNPVIIKLKKTGVTAAAHTIKVQWKTQSNTLRIEPVARDDEYASLIVQEVSV